MYNNPMQYVTLKAEKNKTRKWHCTNCGLIVFSLCGVNLLTANEFMPVSLEQTEYVEVHCSRCHEEYRIIGFTT